ncbi:MAG: type II secretion system protein [Pseudoxanthomonas sp.]|jgi:prepilin-type N-terminal cleavage/methylation domain-containing protein|nr:type II secretion system protein [Pseudoxanthomonas sp.]
MQRQSGFSLLETLIALVVMTLCFGALLPLIVTNLERVEADALLAEALLLAANQLETHAVIAEDTQGQYEGQEGSLSWKATVEPAGPAAGEAGAKPYALRRVHVDVFSRERKPLVSLETYRAGVIR